MFPSGCSCCGLCTLALVVIGSWGFNLSFRKCLNTRTSSCHQTHCDRPMLIKCCFSPNRSDNVFFFVYRFNYRSTHHLTTNGFYEFLNWFDERAWYPLGRIVGGTVSLPVVFLTFNLFSSVSYFSCFFSFSGNTLQ